jgi:hypothetical protein
MWEKINKKKYTIYRIAHLLLLIKFVIRFDLHGINNRKRRDKKSTDYNAKLKLANAIS